VASSEPSTRAGGCFCACCIAGRPAHSPRHARFAAAKRPVPLGTRPCGSPSAPSLTPSVIVHHSGAQGGGLAQRRAQRRAPALRVLEKWSVHRVDSVVHAGPAVRVQRLHNGYPPWQIEPCMARWCTVTHWWRMFTFGTPSCQCTVFSRPAYKQLRAASRAVLAYTEQTKQNALAGPSHLLHIHCERALAHRIHLDSRGARGGRRFAAAGRRRRRGVAASRPARRTSPPGRRRCHTRWPSCARPAGPAGRRTAWVLQLECLHGAGVHHSPWHSGGRLWAGRSESAGVYMRRAGVHAWAGRMHRPCAPHSGRACVWGPGRMPRVSHGLTMTALAPHADS